MLSRVIKFVNKYCKIIVIGFVALTVTFLLFKGRMRQYLDNKTETKRRKLFFDIKANSVVSEYHELKIDELHERIVKKESECLAIDDEIDSIEVKHAGLVAELEKEDKHGMLERFKKLGY